MHNLHKEHWLTSSQRQAIRSERMKQWILGAILVVVLVGLAFVLPGRKGRPAGATPEEVINALFDAAKEGDDRAYLDLIGEPLRETLQRTRSEIGVEAFREDLRRSASGIKGLAIQRAENEPPGFAALEVELVFADRNERQRMLLTDQEGNWLITAIEPAQTDKPPIPYGTPVFEEP